MYGVQPQSMQPAPQQQPQQQAFWGQWQGVSGRWSVPIRTLNTSKPLRGVKALSRSGMADILSPFAFSRGTTAMQGEEWSC
jgi:hypothetical protein